MMIDKDEIIKKAIDKVSYHTSEMLKDVFPASYDTEELFYKAYTSYEMYLEPSNEIPDWMYLLVDCAQSQVNEISKDAVIDEYAKLCAKVLYGEIIQSFVDIYVNRYEHDIVTFVL